MLRAGLGALLALAMAGPAGAQAPLPEPAPEGEPQIESAKARYCDPDCRARKLADGELTAQQLLAPDGRLRTYWLYEPAGLSTKDPVPLLVVLHGGMGDGLMYQDWTGFDAIAKEEGFIVAYPEGFGRVWNARTCCFVAWRLNVDDVGFMDSLVDQVSSRRSIDAARVYATGHSNGAMLSGVIACESSRFAGVAAVAGAMGPPCAPQAPVSVLYIHGTGDNNAPYEGGDGSDGFTSTEHYPVRAAAADWRDRNECPEPEVTAAGKVTRELSEGCAAGTAVGLYTIDGGGHPWPGSKGDSVRGTQPSQALDASLAVWEFLKARPRQGG